MELTAEAIVAGSKELDRRKEVLNTLMRMLMAVIAAEYSLESLRYEELLGTFNEIRVFICKDFATMKLCLSKKGDDGILLYWDSSTGHDLSLKRTSALWEIRDDILNCVTARFPEIKPRFALFADCAPTQ